MFEVIVDGLRYIRDVPLELTEAAISSGALVKGVVIGLMVHPPNQPENYVLVDIKLTEEGQQALLRPGLAVFLEEVSGIYRFPPCWRQLINLRQKTETVDIPDNGEKKTIRPNPSHF